MARSFEEVLRIALQTAGEEDVRKLAETLEGLGEVGAQLRDRLSVLFDELSRTEELRGAAADYERLAGAQEDLSSAVDRAGLRLRLATQQEAAAAQAVDERRQALERAKAALADYAASGERSVQTEKQLGEAVRAATREVAAAETAWKQSGRTLKEAGTDYERAAEAQNRLQQRLAPLAERIEQAGLSTKDLAAAQAELAQRSTNLAAQLGDVGQAALESARAEGEFAETAQESADRIRDMVAASLERVDAERRAVEERRRGVQVEREAAEAVQTTAETVERAAASQDRLGASARATLQDLQDYEGILQRGAGSAEELADQEERLDRLRASGAISVEEYNAALDKLTKDEEALAKAAERAAKEQEKLARENRGVGQSADQASGPVDRLQSTIRRLIAGAAGFLTLRKLKDTLVDILTTGDRFDRLGQQLGVVFGGFEAGQAALGRFREIARDVPNSLEEVVQAGIRLKTLGLDPLDGSLEAVLNQTAALGGEQETLRRISLALGQAWAKQKLQAQEINQLVEAGVPVYELLSQATGKNVVQVRELAAQGRLGANAVRDLISAMAEANQGAAAQGVNTLTGAWAKLRDSVSDAYNQIAQSGPLDFVRDQINRVRERIDELASNGSLQRWAEGVGASITTVLGFFERLVGGLLSVGRTVTGVVDRIRNSLLGEAIGEVASAVGRLVGFVGQGLSGLNSLIQRLVGVKQPAEEAGSALDSVNRALEQLQRANGATAASSVAAAEAALRNAEASLEVADALLEQSRAELQAEQARLTAIASTRNLTRAELARLAELERVVAEQEDSVRSLEAGTTALQANLSMLRQQAQAAADVSEQLAEQEAKARRLTDAYEELGIKSTSALNEARDAARANFDVIEEAAKRGEASWDDARRAFEVYAQKAREAVSEGTAEAKAQVEAQLQLKRAVLDLVDAQKQSANAAEEQQRRQLAAMQALRGQVAAAASAIGNELAQALAAGTDPEKVERLRAEMRALDAEIQALNGAIANTQAQLSGTADAGSQAAAGIRQAAEASADLQQNLAGAADQGQTVGETLYGAMLAARSEFEATSQAAAELFDRNLFEASELGRSIDDFFRAIQNAQEATRQAVEQEKTLIETQIRGFQNLTRERAEYLLQTGRGVENLERAAANAERNFTLMGEQDLSRLRSALQSAANQVRQINQETAAAVDGLEQLGDQLRRNALQRANDQAALAKLEYEEQLKRIKELEEQGGASARALAEENRRLARQEYEARLAELRELEKQEKESVRRAADEKRRQGAGSGSSSGAGAGGAQGGSTPPGGGLAAAGPNVTINVPGLEPVRIGVRNQRDVDTLQAFLEQLTRAQRNSGFGGGPR